MNPCEYCELVGTVFCTNKPLVCAADMEQEAMMAAEAILDNISAGA